MRPFFGGLFLFFILSFCETEASWTPRFLKSKKSESSKNASGASQAVDLTDTPAAPVIRGRSKGKNTRDLNRDDYNRDSPAVKEARRIRLGAPGEVTYAGQQQAFQDNQDLNFEKDMKQYQNYRLFEEHTRLSALPAYPPVPTANYGNYYSGGGAHLGHFEDSYNQHAETLHSQQEQAIHNRQLQALHDQQRQAFHDQQLQALHNQQLQAFHDQQLQARHHQQQTPGTHSGGAEPWLSLQQPNADGTHNSGGSEDWLRLQQPYNDGTQNPHIHGGASGGGSSHGGHPGNYGYDHGD